MRTIFSLKKQYKVKSIGTKSCGMKKEVFCIHDDFIWKIFTSHIETRHKLQRCLLRLECKNFKCTYSQHFWKAFRRGETFLDDMSPFSFDCLLKRPFYEPKLRYNSAAISHCDDETLQLNGRRLGWTQTAHVKYEISIPNKLHQRIAPVPS